MFPLYIHFNGNHFSCSFSGNSPGSSNKDDYNDNGTIINIYKKVYYTNLISSKMVPLTILDGANSKMMQIAIFNIYSIYNIHE